MTLFTFYNYFDVPLIFEFVIAISHVFPKVRFLPESKMAYFTNILTFILSLLPHFWLGCVISDVGMFFSYASSFTLHPCQSVGQLVIISN